jgi:hypothetical protein
MLSVKANVAFVTLFVAVEVALAVTLTGAKILQIGTRKKSVRKVDMHQHVPAAKHKRAIINRQCLPEETLFKLYFLGCSFGFGRPGKVANTFHQSASIFFHVTTQGIDHTVHFDANTAVTVKILQSFRQKVPLP